MAKATINLGMLILSVLLSALVVLSFTLIKLSLVTLVFGVLIRGLIVGAVAALGVAALGFGFNLLKRAASNIVKKVFAKAQKVEEEIESDEVLIW